LKKLVRQSQRDHDRETADHGVMVRELQTLLSTERNKLETMEHHVSHPLGMELKLKFNLV
jgi:hypothetical protein